MPMQTLPVLQTGPYRYVDTDPDSDASPVVLLHGMMGGVKNWSSTATALARESIRTLIPELPIYSIEPAKASLGGLTRFVVEFLGAVGAPGYVVVGNSLGGHIAARIAIYFQDLVHTLVLTGASGIFEIDLGRTIMRRRDRTFVRERAEKTFFDPAMCTEELMDEVMATLNSPGRVKRLIRVTRSIQKGSVRDHLSEIRCPTLLIWGKEDRVTPLDVAETFHRGIEDSALRVIERCGHAPMMERPDEFDRILVDYVKKAVVAREQTVAG